jgi:hypothetical protein
MPAKAKKRMAPSAEDPDVGLVEDTMRARANKAKAKAAAIPVAPGVLNEAPDLHNADYYTRMTR